MIDLEGFVRVSAVLSYLTGARRRVGRAAQAGQLPLCAAPQLVEQRTAHPPKDGAASTSLDRPEGPGRAYAPQSTESAAWRLAAASAARLRLRPGAPRMASAPPRLFVTPTTGSTPPKVSGNLDRID